MMNDQKEATLRIISKHDGSWGWYQIDRALSAAGISAGGVNEVLAELVDEGLIVCDGDANLAASRYSLTPVGRIHLEGLDE